MWAHGHPARRAITGLLLFVCLMIHPQARADWPQFRGPNYDDVSRETGLLRQWPAGGPTLAWKATGLGLGFSGVSIVGDRLFTMGDRAGAQYVIALSLRTHKELWATKVGPAFVKNFKGPRCTPTVEGGLVAALTPQGVLVCLDAGDGQELWRHDLVNEYGAQKMQPTEYAYAESPLIDRDKIVCTPGGPRGAVLAFAKRTGKVIWRATTVKDPASYSSLVPVEFGGVRQYIQLSDRSVYAVAANSGKLLWKAPFPGHDAVVATPIFKDGIVFVTASYKIGGRAYRLTAASGAFKADPLYAVPDLANHHGGVVLVGDYLYGYSDSNMKLKCVELKTGKVMWEDKAAGKGSLTCADGRLYLRNEYRASAVALIEATPAGYRECGRFIQPERSREAAWTHPVVCGGELYLRDQDLLLVYDVKQ